MTIIAAASMCNIQVQAVESTHWNGHDRIGTVLATPPERTTRSIYRTEGNDTTRRRMGTARKNKQTRGVHR
jgi:hypothetical protein